MHDLTLWIQTHQSDSAGILAGVGHVATLRRDDLLALNEGCIIYSDKEAAERGPRSRA